MSARYYKERRDGKEREKCAIVSPHQKSKAAACVDVGRLRQHGFFFGFQSH